VNRSWQFWIDVGGTFTDCIGRASDGSLRQCKVLSSGVVKVPVLGVDDDSCRVGGIGDYPAGFFAGYRIVVFDVDGGSRGRGMIVASDEQGRLEVGWEERLPGPVGRAELDGGEPAPLLAIRRTLGLRLDAPIGSVDVRLGTTRGTNALLERKGAKTAFVTNVGFRDLLHIGDQDRPRLFDLDIRKRRPLAERSVEIGGRLDADGREVEGLCEDEIERLLVAERDAGVEALAICLLHSYADDSHERRVAELAAEQGFEQISVSSRVSPTIKLVARSDTTVVDAYLTPVIREYVARLRSALPEARLRLMTSAGGLVSADVYSGRDTILSGPAGGVAAGDRVRHGRDVDRRQSLLGRSRLSVREREGGRADRDADVGDRDGGLRRRLDLLFRWSEAGRRAA
jgi:5-oxoprolinase (ATP-hydrolysing)